MMPHRPHRTARGRDGNRGAREFGSGAEPAPRRAVSWRIERHDAMTIYEQRAAQVHEPRAPAPPSMHEQNARPALAPCPRRDPALADSHVEPPRVPQPRSHALADRAAWSRTKDSRRPSGGEIGRGSLQGAERGARQPEGGSRWLL